MKSYQLQYQDSRHLIKLTNEECNRLCNSSSAIQIESARHILITANNKMYKIIYSDHESKAFYVYFVEPKRHCRLIIHPEVVKKPTPLIYSYHVSDEV